MLCYLTEQNPKIEKILGKNENGFQKKCSVTLQILTLCRSLEGVRAKNIVATLLFVDFSNVFDTIYRGNMDQILLANDLLKETVAAIMMLYENIKVKVSSMAGDTEYFAIGGKEIHLPYTCLFYVKTTSFERP